MVKVQPTTDHDGVAAAAPSDLAEVVEAPAPACTQEHESDGMEDRMVKRMDAKFDEVLKFLRARPT